MIFSSWEFKDSILSKFYEQGIVGWRYGGGAGVDETLKDILLVLAGAIFCWRYCLYFR